jgi:hypothetical protein
MPYRNRKLRKNAATTTTGSPAGWQGRWRRYGDPEVVAAKAQVWAAILSSGAIAIAIVGVLVSFWASATAKDVEKANENLTFAEQQKARAENARDDAGKALAAATERLNVVLGQEAAANARLKEAETSSAAQMAEARSQLADLASKLASERRSLQCIDWRASLVSADLKWQLTQRFVDQVHAYCLDVATEGEFAETMIHRSLVSCAGRVANDTGHLLRERDRSIKEQAQHEPASPKSRQLARARAAYDRREDLRQFDTGAVAEANAGINAGIARESQARGKPRDAADARSLIDSSAPLMPPRPKRPAAPHSNCSASGRA